MNKQQLILLAKRRVDEKRQNAQTVCENTLAKLREQDDWRSCEHSLKRAQVAFVLHKDESAKAKIEKFERLQKLLLKKYNLSEQDLHPHYCCTKCNDTGYAKGKACDCLKAELRNLLVDESNVVNKTFTFENSKETNKHNLAVAKKAQEVCSDENLKNVLLIGGTGTGKTYLLSACANRCATLGKSVFFTTAYNLGSLFLECHLSDLATKQTILDNLADVDVLVIDDLGTENVYKDVTAQYLFALVNERMVRGKQTFFSTNLPLGDFRDKYDERIFSRLVDQNITLVAQLQGADKRVKK